MPRGSAACGTRSPAAAEGDEVGTRDGLVHLCDMNTVAVMVVGKRATRLAEVGQAVHRGTIDKAGHAGVDGEAKRFPVGKCAHVLTRPGGKLPGDHGRVIDDQPGRRNAALRRFALSGHRQHQRVPARRHSHGVGLGVRDGAGIARHQFTGRHSQRPGRPRFQASIRAGDAGRRMGDHQALIHSQWLRRLPDRRAEGDHGHTIRRRQMRERRTGRQAQRQQWMRQPGRSRILLGERCDILAKQGRVARTTSDLIDLVDAEKSQLGPVAEPRHRKAKSIGCDRNQLRTLRMSRMPRHDLHIALARCLAHRRPSSRCAELRHRCHRISPGNLLNQQQLVVQPAKVTLHNAT